MAERLLEPEADMTGSPLGRPLQRTCRRSQVETVERQPKGQHAGVEQVGRWALPLGLVVSMGEVGLNVSDAGDFGRLWAVWPVPALGTGSRLPGSSRAQRFRRVAGL